MPGSAPGFTRLAHVAPRGLAASPDSRFAALLTDRKLFILAGDGRVLAETALHAGPRGVAWSPTGGRVYATLANGHVAYFAWDGFGLDKLGELAVEPAETQGHPGTADLAIGPDGTAFALLASRRQIVGIGRQGEETMRRRFSSIPKRLQISPDGNTLAVTLHVAKEKPIRLFLDRAGRESLPPARWRPADPELPPASVTMYPFACVSLRRGTLLVGPSRRDAGSVLVAAR